MLGPQTIVPQQCQAARVLLSWSQAKLAELAGVAYPALVRFERGGTIDLVSLLAIKRVLEAADIHFMTRADGTTGVSLMQEQNRIDNPDKFA